MQTLRTTYHWVVLWAVLVLLLMALLSACKVENSYEGGGGTDSEVVGGMPEFYPDGMYTVDKTIFPGMYRTDGDDLCHYTRTTASGEVIANANGSGPQIITIAPTDIRFLTKGCGQWTTWTARTGRADPNATFGEGIYFVGREVAPGTWRAEGDGCYWARLSGFGGTIDEILANDNTSGPTIVTIDGSEAGFSSARCGDWTKQQ